MIGTQWAGDLAQDVMVLTPLRSVLSGSSAFHNQTR